MMDQQGVSVGLGRDEALGPRRPAGAGDVLDDDLLAERAAHMLAEQGGRSRRWDRRRQRARSG